MGCLQSRVGGAHNNVGLFISFSGGPSGPPYLVICTALKGGAQEKKVVLLRPSKFRVSGLSSGAGGFTNGLLARWSGCGEIVSVKRELMIAPAHAYPKGRVRGQGLAVGDRNDDHIRLALAIGSRSYVSNLLAANAPQDESFF
jgi:hypothetical protein